MKKREQYSTSKSTGNIGRGSGWTGIFLACILTTITLPILFSSYTACFGQPTKAHAGKLLFYEEAAAVMAGAIRKIILILHAVFQESRNVYEFA